MTAYYNEHDPFAAAWLRELIKDGLVAAGEVDERGIEDVQPEDLRGFTQCHFFAGIGVWSYALRAARWSDDTPVWTGSCPCQSFSQSGKGGGFSDKRHLWPTWFRLISESRPDVCFGEQVSGADGRAWYDVVAADMEGIGYAIGSLGTTAAGIGAFHIRQRLYFVAQSDSERLEGQRLRLLAGEPRDAGIEVGRGGEAGIVADFGRRRREQRDEGERVIQQSNENSNLGNAVNEGLEGHSRNGDDGYESGRNRTNEARPVTTPSLFSELADTEYAGLDGARTDAPEQGGDGQADGLLIGSDSGLRRSFWSDAEWIYCKDGKYRPVKPGIFPLVNGATNRVGTLRGAGNALCAPQAQAFIEAYLSI